MNKAAKSTRKYKIAYVIDGLSMGGAERLMVPILKHLSRNVFDAYVCALQSKDGNPMADEIRALGVPVHGSHPPWGYHLWIGVRKHRHQKHFGSNASGLAP